MADMYTTLNTSRSYIYHVARSIDSGKLASKVRDYASQKRCFPSGPLAQCAANICSASLICYLLIDIYSVIMKYSHFTLHIGVAWLILGLYLEFMEIQNDV